MVIGVGNPLRGDDGAGLAVVEDRIVETRGVRVVAHPGEGSDLLRIWEGADAAVIVDAMASGGEPGTIVRFDASREPLPAGAAGRPTGHSVGIAETIEMARALGRLPRDVVVLGVVGANFELGAGLSEPVAAALDALAEAVVAEAQRLGPSRSRVGRTRGSRSR